MKQNKGISLIVLIVTIIVMIIISGAIIMSLNQTNVIDQAEEAVEKHNLSELKSAASMAYSDWLLKENLPETDSPQAKSGQAQNYIRKELVEQGLLTWQETSKYYISPTGGIEEIDQDAIIYRIQMQAGRNHKIEISGDGEIDWGDGTTSGITNRHSYNESGIYEVKITGDVDFLIMEGFSSSNINELIEVKSWGNTNISEIYISNYSNLRYIAMPNSNSFGNLTVFMMDHCSIEELPDYFFENSKLESASFESNSNFKYIPGHLFDGCTALNDVTALFKDCTLLTGNAPELWNNTNITSYSECFKNCTKLSNYADIPDAWK